MAECIHGMDPAWCSLCLKPAKKRTQLWGGAGVSVLQGGEVVASFDGRCAADCGEPIEEGDPIHFSDEHGGWTHVSC